MLARLLTAHDVILSQCMNQMVNSEEVLELYADLIKLDPTHCQYYKDEHSLVFLQQVISLVYEIKHYPPPFQHFKLIVDGAATCHLDVYSCSCVRISGCMERPICCLKRTNVYN